MNPYENVVLILVFALLSTFNALFRETRWLSFVCLCLAIFGVTGLVGETSANKVFFYFGPTCIVIFLIAALFSGTFQRVFFGLFAVTILVGSSSIETLAPDFFEKSVVHLVLFGASMLLPALVGSVAAADEMRVEKIISAQQFWTRIVFLEWCRINFTNVHHYDFFAMAIPALTVAAAAILIFRMWLSRGTWFFSARSFLSLTIMVGGLTVEAGELKFLILWTIFLSLMDLSPGLWEGRSFNLSKRFGLGAFGGLAFSGLLFLLNQAPMEIYWKTAWAIMTFVFGAFVLLLPGTRAEQEANNSWLGALEYLPHAVFFTLLFYWPSIRDMAG